MTDATSENLHSKHLAIFLHEVSKRLPPPTLKAISMLSTRDFHMNDIGHKLAAMIEHALDEAYQAYPTPHMINSKLYIETIKKHLMSIMSHYGIINPPDEAKRMNNWNMVNNAILSAANKFTLQISAELQTRERPTKLRSQFDAVCKPGKDSEWYIDFVGHLTDWIDIVFVTKECSAMIVNALKEIGCKEFLRRYPDKQAQLMAAIVDALNNDVTLPPEVLREVVMMINSHPDIGSLVSHVFGVRAFDNPSYMVKRQMDILLTSVAQLGPVGMRDVLFSITGSITKFDPEQLDKLQSGHLIDSLTGKLYDPNKSNSQLEDSVGKDVK